MSWIVIQQDEGLMVDWQSSKGLPVLFIDWDEAKENPDYCRSKFEDLLDVEALIPEHLAGAIRKGLVGNLEKHGWTRIEGDDEAAWEGPRST